MVTVENRTDMITVIQCLYEEPYKSKPELPTATNDQKKRKL